MSLFKNGMMRKADKPSLREVIMPEEKAVMKGDIKNCDTYVLDGGALLHRVRWSKGIRFIEIADTYLKYMRKNYPSNITIVFDGYKDESTKSHEHLRRNCDPQSCNVNICAENQVPFTQDRFLSNTKNKAALIGFLSHHMKEHGIFTINCPGDADSAIVETAIQAAKKNLGSVTVVADDTDIAVMLVHHYQENISEVFFLQERSNKAWNVKEASSRNEGIKKHFLFLHAWSGCDTTSSVLVGDASIKAFKLLYGGKEDDTLTKLRYNKYIDLACKGIISPEKLPPSERAAYFHGLRSHHQIFLWSLIPDDGLKLEATDWGWKMQDDVMTPIMNDKHIAQDSLTKIIRCKCKTTSKNPCGTKTCTCRKYGMRCLSSCGECCGVDCSNSEEVHIEDEEEREEDYLDDDDIFNI
eukprot:gene19666-21613_t